MRRIATTILSASWITASAANPLLPRTDTSSLICSRKGWDAGHESYFSPSAPYTTSYADCASFCTPPCASFAWNPNPGKCQLYDVRATGNFVPDESSPYIFYDKDCETKKKQCNIAGYSRVDSWYYTNDSSSTAADCAGVCTGYGVTCSSWAFSRGECFLYNALVADNVDVDISSPYKFSDRACASSSSTTTTMTTTKSSTKTTTTSTTRSTTKTMSTGSTMTTTRTTTSAFITTTSMKKSSPTTRATTAATTQSSLQLVCGQEGYMSGSSGFHGYYTPYDTPTQEALSQCYNYCVTTTESYCTAWVWSANSCVLYSYGVDGHFQSSDSGSYVWDHRCGSPVATVSSLTTTVTTAKKTTTTTEAPSTITTTIKGTTTTTKSITVTTKAVTTTKVATTSPATTKVATTTRY